MSTPVLYTAAFNMVDLETYVVYGKGSHPVYVSSPNLRELTDAIRYGAVQIAILRAFKHAITPRRMALSLVLSRVYPGMTTKERRYTIPLHHIKTFRDMYIKARKVYIPTKRTSG